MRWEKRGSLTVPVSGQRPPRRAKQLLEDFRGIRFQAAFFSPRKHLQAGVMNCDTWLNVEYESDLAPCDPCSGLELFQNGVKQKQSYEQNKHHRLRLNEALVENWTKAEWIQLAEKQSVERCQDSCCKLFVASLLTISQRSSTLCSHV